MVINDSSDKERMYENIQSYAFEILFFSEFIVVFYITDWFIAGLEVKKKMILKPWISLIEISENYE
jgi:hypothetical protein